VFVLIEPVAAVISIIEFVDVNVKLEPVKVIGLLDAVTVN
jgi:hypothetical protein